MLQKKRIIFDATLFVNAYETKLFRTGLYRVSEQLLKQLQQLNDYDIWLYDTMGRERIMRQYVMPNYPTCQLLSSESKAYIILTDKALQVADDYREKQMSEKNGFSRCWYQVWKNVLRAYGRMLRRLSSGKKIPMVNPNAHYLATYYPIPQWVHQQGLTATLIVHDLIPIAHPEWFPTDANKRTLESIVHSVTERDRVVCVSESTRQDLLAYRTDLSPEQVTVAHLAGAEVFKPTPLSDTLRQRIGINFEYILSVCTLEPRKNLQLVVKAYERLLQNNVDTKLPQLVLVGAIGWKTGELIDQINMLNAHYPKQVIITGYIEDEELTQLYTSATMFVYPSLYEGFGLPPLEAMQCGCPVITSNVSSLPEVVGAAGITINPTDFNMLVSAMEKIRHDGRDKYVQQSLERSGEFSWRKMAQQVIKTIQ